MGPKKGKKATKNAFYFYMLEYKTRHKIFNLKKVASLAGPTWASMSPEEREPYEKIAAKERAAINDKLNSLGIPISDHEELTNLAAERAQVIENDIKQIVDTLGIDPEDKLPNHKFYFLHLNCYVRTEKGYVVPAEFAISEFSLQKGVERVYSTFLNIRDVPSGYSCMARDVAHQTHKIPLPPFRRATTDATQVVLRMQNFVRGFDLDDYIRGELKFTEPVIMYTANPELDTVKECLAALLSESDLPYPFLYKVYPIEQLYFTLGNFCANLQGAPGYPSKALAYKEFNKDIFSYTLNISCEYHEEEDVTSFCSRSKVRRWGYTIADYCCKELGITLEANRHIPPNANLDHLQKVAGKFTMATGVPGYQPKLQKGWGNLNKPDRGPTYNKCPPPKNNNGPGPNCNNGPFNNDIPNLFDNRPPEHFNNNGPPPFNNGPAPFHDGPRGSFNNGPCGPPGFNRGPDFNGRPDFNMGPQGTFNNNGPGFNNGPGGPGPGFNNGPCGPPNFHDGPPGFNDGPFDNGPFNNGPPGPFPNNGPPGPFPNNGPPGPFPNNGPPGPFPNNGFPGPFPNNGPPGPFPNNGPSPFPNNGPPCPFPNDGPSPFPNNGPNPFPNNGPPGPFPNNGHPGPFPNNGPSSFPNNAPGPFPNNGPPGPFPNNGPGPFPNNGPGPFPINGPNGPFPNNAPGPFPNNAPVPFPNNGPGPFPNNNGPPGPFPNHGFDNGPCGFNNGPGGFNNNHPNNVPPGTPFNCDGSPTVPFCAPPVINSPPGHLHNGPSGFGTLNPYNVPPGPGFGTPNVVNSPPGLGAPKANVEVPPFNKVTVTPEPAGVKSWEPPVRRPGEMPIPKIEDYENDDDDVPSTQGAMKDSPFSRPASVVSEVPPFPSRLDTPSKKSDFSPPPIATRTIATREPSHGHRSPSESMTSFNREIMEFNFDEDDDGFSSRSKSERYRERDYRRSSEYRHHRRRERDGSYDRERSRERSRERHERSYDRDRSRERDDSIERDEDREHGREKHKKKHRSSKKKSRRRSRSRESKREKRRRKHSPSNTKDVATGCQIKTEPVEELPDLIPPDQIKPEPDDNKKEWKFPKLIKIDIPERPSVPMRLRDPRTRYFPLIPVDTQPQ